MTNSEQLAKAVSVGNLWAVSQRLALQGDEHALQLSNLCSRIFEETEAEAVRLSRLAADLDANVTADRGGQLHLIEVSASTREDAQRFVERIQRDGYTGWQDFDGAAAESFFRHERQATLVALEGTAFTVVVRWGKSRRAGRVPRPLRPTAADHNFVDLPSKLWPAYLALRPVRLVKDRVRRSGGRASLGPILSTPEALLEPLFEFAQIEPQDHLVDLGSGEGRVVLAAVEQRHCTATGVEKDPRLVELARQRLAASSVDPRRVHITQADADNFSLHDATVVFLFIPAEEVADTVYRIRGDGFEGRIISHEQRYIPGGVKPIESKVLMGTNALTVGHLW